MPNPSDTGSAPPLDVDRLRRLCDIRMPTPTYRTGSSSYTPEFQRDWKRFAAARRSLAGAVPHLIAELTTLRAQRDTADTLRDALSNYGEHRRICPRYWNRDDACTCGFSELTQDGR